MLLRLVVVCGASHEIPVIPGGGVTDGIRARPPPVDVWFEDEPSGSGGPCDIRPRIRTGSCEKGAEYRSDSNRTLKWGSDGVKRNKMTTYITKGAPSFSEAHPKKLRS